MNILGHFLFDLRGREINFGRVKGCPKAPDGPYDLFPSKFHRIWSYSTSQNPLFDIDGKLESHGITEWSQNLPYGPGPREQKLLFSIFTYPIIHLKNRKNENQVLGFPNKINELP